MSYLWERWIWWYVYLTGYGVGPRQPQSILIKMYWHTLLTVTETLVLMVILSNGVEQERSLPATCRALSTSWGRMKTRWGAGEPRQPHLYSCDRAWLRQSSQPGDQVWAAVADRERNHCSPCSRYLRGVNINPHYHHWSVSPLYLMLLLIIWSRGRNVEILGSGSSSITTILTRYIY